MSSLENAELCTFRFYSSGVVWLITELKVVFCNVGALTRSASTAKALNSQRFKTYGFYTVM